MDTALVPTVEGVAAPAFKPKPAMRLYVTELVDRLADGRPTTDRQMALALNIDRKVIHRWQHDPAFTAWLSAQLEAVRTAGKSRVLTRAQALAEKGSIAHMDFLAKVLGWYPQQGGLPGGTGPVQINILVPRP